MFWKPEELAVHRLGIYDLGDQLKQHIYSRSVKATAAGDQARDRVKTQEDVERRKEAARAAFLAGIGELPQTDHPLAAQITGEIKLEEMRLESIVFESRPHTHVTGTMYIPEGLSLPAAAVLFVCGHFGEGRLAPNYQSVCQTIARAGMIVFAIDPPGQGERANFCDPSTGELAVPCGTSDHEQAGVKCWPLGDGLARYFIHDIVRAVDYLCTRPEVDPQRIGITGNSGGGLQTTMAMLVESRLAAAAPATFVMNRESYLFAGQAQDAEQIWPGMTARGFDHEDLLLALAPKPVLVLAAEYDFFPIEGTRRSVARAQRFWEIYGKAGGLQLFEDRCTHQYSPAMADAAASFFAAQFKVRQASEQAGVPQPLPIEQLYATRHGQVRRDYAGERGISEMNAERLLELEQRRRQMPDEQCREQGLRWLSDKVFDGRNPVPWNPRQWTVGEVGAGAGAVGEGLTAESWLWWSQEGLFNHAYLFRSPRDGVASADSPLVIAVWERGTRRLDVHWAWIEETAAAGKTVMVLDVCGEGAATPHPINAGELYGQFGTMHKLATDLFWLDDSLGAMRIFDICRAIAFVQESGYIEAGQVEVYGCGAFALYVTLAAALDTERKVGQWRTAEDGAASVAEWVRDSHSGQHFGLETIVPGMLQYFDLPDLRRWTR
ncbi:alpha/beta hydrolase family protein [Paenibacillus sp. GCM10027626]|uniref:alpha/beta hydrolase family protein n=1 Tax=Paenibacillus sp. GCM10027626 TaxID=3273411 RepID=UPI003636392B